MSLRVPSAEQRSILDRISEGMSHVIVIAVAGSGKSTVVLNACKESPNRKCLMLTFNTALREEISDKADLLGLTNLEVHNYHSLAVKYYSDTAFDDVALQDLVDDAARPRGLLDVDVIFVDEAQDMRATYVGFVNKVVSDMKLTPQFVVLGDPRQAVYAGIGASVEYLTDADVHFAEDQHWVRATMSTSFRLTEPICAFLNKHVFQEDLLVPGRKPPVAPPVAYVIANTFELRTAKYVAGIVAAYDPGDVMLLFPSMKSSNVLAQNIVGLLKDMHIPVYVGTSDEGSLTDKEVLRGKVILTTFHKSKGLERPLVVVSNFDASYYEYYAVDVEDKSVCTPPVSVACTRASRHLVLIRGHNSEPFPTVDESSLRREGVDVVTLREPRGRGPPKPSKKRQRGVTDALHFAAPTTKRACLAHINVANVVPHRRFGEEELKLKRSKITRRFGNHRITENVASLYGIAIPAKAEFLKTGSCYIGENAGNHPDVVAIANKMRVRETPSNAEFLVLAKHWESKNGYPHRMAQVGDEVDWVDDDHVDECVGRIVDTLGDDVEFEVLVNSDDVVGRIDCVERRGSRVILWEFKCGTVNRDHHIQMALYLSLFKSTVEGSENAENVTARLLDVARNEIVEVTESGSLMQAVTDSWK